MTRLGVRRGEGRTYMVPDVKDHPSNRLSGRRVGVVAG